MTADPRACAGRYGIPLIEDAAEALGATYRGRPAGTLRPHRLLLLQRQQDHHHQRRRDAGRRDAGTGRTGPLPGHPGPRSAPHYEHVEIGYNYRMSNLLAAVGRGQLRVLDERVAAAAPNFRFYQQALGDLPGIGFMPEHAPRRDRPAG